MRHRTWRIAKQGLKMRPCTQLLPLRLSRETHADCWAKREWIDQGTYTDQVWAPGATHRAPSGPALSYTCQCTHILTLEAPSPHQHSGTASERWQRQTWGKIERLRN